MYTSSTQGYSSNAIQNDKGFLDYIPEIEIGNNESTSVVTGLIDYMVLNEMGYYKDASGTPSSSLDYMLLNDWGYSRDNIQYTTGIVDYLIDNIPFNILIEQERGWGFNWELITTLWETIDNNWE
tara:strand:- start:2158 stop:2532 length:375 start_codon:yes stop_codon:yes gene_type:complete